MEQQIVCSHLPFLFGTGTDDGTADSVFTSALFVWDWNRRWNSRQCSYRNDDDDENDDDDDDDDGGGGGGGGGDNKVKVADETCLVLEQTMEQ